MSIDLPQPDSTGRVVPPGVVVSGGGTAGSPPPADALEVNRLRRDVRRLREVLANQLFGDPNPPAIAIRSVRALYASRRRTPKTVRALALFDVLLETDPAEQEDGR